MRANLVIDARETNTGICGSPALLRRRGRSSTILLICGSALDPVAWRFLRAVKGRSVSIGKRTSDNGVDVHGKRVSTCTVASVYVVVSLMVTASLSQLAAEREMPVVDGSAPPLWTPWRGASACARRCSPPGGRSRPNYPSREGPRAPLQARRINGSVRPPVADSRQPGSPPSRP